MTKRMCRQLTVSGVRLAITLLTLSAGGCILSTSRFTQIKKGFDYELYAGPTLFANSYFTDSNANVVAGGPYAGFRFSYGFSQQVAVEASCAGWLGWPGLRELNQLSYGWLQPGIGVKVRPYSANSLFFLEYRALDLGLGFTQGLPLHGDEVVSATVEVIGTAPSYDSDWWPYGLNGNIACNLFPGHIRLSPNLGIALTTDWSEGRFQLAGLQFGVTYSPDGRGFESSDYQGGD